MYLGIVGQVIFKNSAGEEWKFEAPTYPFVSGITVAVERELITTFQVSFDAPYEEGIKLVEMNPGPFAVGNMVKARIGYSDMNLFTPWYKGMLQQGGDGITVSPDGIGGSVSAQVLGDQAFYSELGDKPYDPNTAEPIEKLKWCCLMLGLKLELLPGGTVAFMDISPFWGGTTMKQKPWSTMCGKTWWEILKILCEKATCSYWIGEKDGEDVIYVDSNDAISKGESMKAMSADGVRNYVMRGKFDPAANQWPIISFGPDPALASWVGSTISPARHGTTTAGIDMATGKPVKVEVPALESAEAIYGPAKPTGKPKNKKVDGKELNRELDAGAETTEHVSAPMAPGKEGEDGAKKDGANKVGLGNPALIATIETIGCPKEQPFSLVNVFGCSARFNGPYEVMGVTHTFAAGSFDTSVKVLRHGAMFLSQDTPESAGKGGNVPPAK